MESSRYHWRRKFICWMIFEIWRCNYQNAAFETTPLWIDEYMKGIRISLLSSCPCKKLVLLCKMQDIFLSEIHQGHCDMHVNFAFENINRFINLKLFLLIRTMKFCLHFSKTSCFRNSFCRGRKFERLSVT